MNTYADKEKNTLEIARDTLRKLALAKIPPTPENFKRVYLEIAGEKGSADDVFINSFTNVMTQAGKSNHFYVQLLREIQHALADGDPRKLEQKLWALLPNTAEAKSQPVDDTVNTWRELMVQLLELGLLTQIQGIPDLERKAKVLVEKTKAARTQADLSRLAKFYESYWIKLQENANANSVLNQELMSLFKLLIDNMNMLSQGDDWMQGQIATINDVLGRPLRVDVIHEAKDNLSALLFRQKLIRNSLMDAKNSLKSMAKTCLSMLKTMSSDTGDYHEKILGYQAQLNETHDIVNLGMILENLRKDVSEMEGGAMRSYNQLKEAHEKITACDALVEKLSMELDQASQVAYQDYLTGALNRRGMEEVIIREFSRADRNKKTLSAALLDLDHFRAVNENLGHEVGDVAIRHLADTITSVLRPSDILVRYGGEEFFILLPETDLNEGINILQRVQRELTKALFMHENEKVLITFSAGMTERLPSESQEDIMQRIDSALYEAKNTGRNKVVGVAADFSKSTAGV